MEILTNTDKANFGSGMYQIFSKINKILKMPKDHLLIQIQKGRFGVRFFRICIKVTWIIQYSKLLKAGAARILKITFILTMHKISLILE